VEVAGLPAEPQPALFREPTDLGAAGVPDVRFLVLPGLAAAVLRKKQLGRGRVGGGGGVNFPPKPVLTAARRDAAGPGAMPPAQSSDKPGLFAKPAANSVRASLSGPAAESVGHRLPEDSRLRPSAASSRRRRRPVPFVVSCGRERGIRRRSLRPGRYKPLPGKLGSHHAGGNRGVVASAAESLRLGPALGGKSQPSCARPSTLGGLGRTVAARCASSIRAQE